MIIKHKIYKKIIIGHKNYETLKQSYRQKFKININAHAALIQRTYLEKTLLKQLRQSLLKIINSKPANILIYIPLKNEINIHPLINFLRQQRGIKLFAPFNDFTNKQFSASPFRLPIIRNNFIATPNKSRFYKSHIDVAIIPVLGVDQCFRRIGFGSGMYDKFFNTHENKKHAKSYKIFLSLPCNYINKNITYEGDIKGDEYLSFNIKRKQS